MSNANTYSASTPDPTEEGAPSGRRRPEERLAVVLLRLLGVAFVVCAVLSGMEEIGRISLYWREFGGDETFAWAEAISLAEPAAELILGTYFVLGGQWVFNRVLAPIARRQSGPDTRG